jgi:hypothetical protein
MDNYSKLESMKRSLGQQIALRKLQIKKLKTRLAKGLSSLKQIQLDGYYDKSS